MKKLVFYLSVIAFVFFAFSFTSCKKEEDIKAVVTVKYADDTTQIAPFAHVKLEKYDVNVEGQCDKDGIYSHTFKLEAILNVHAWLDTSQTGTDTEKYGQTTIRLVSGKTVYKTVFIN